MPSPVLRRLFAWTPHTFGLTVPQNDLNSHLYHREDQYSKYLLDAGIEAKNFTKETLLLVLRVKISHLGMPKGVCPQSPLGDSKTPPNPFPWEPWFRRETRPRGEQEKLNPNTKPTHWREYNPGGRGEWWGPGAPAASPLMQGGEWRSLLSRHIL